MIQYKTKASEANLFLSENNLNPAIHHYMYLNPDYFNKITLKEVINSYQKYEFDKYQKNRKYVLDNSIPKELNINENMLFSDYIKIKNTFNYHLIQGDYVYIPILRVQ